MKTLPPSLLRLLLAGAACVGAHTAIAATPAAPPVISDWASIPAGHFTMGRSEGGDPDEAPVHRVELTEAFKISVEEVTLEQFRRFRPAHALSRDGKVTGVSWHDAMAFCAWLSHSTGRHFRLPTEAEWEYAARAGTETPFWSGDQPPADPRAPNPWGLRGVHDDVAEWCLDWYGAYPAGPRKDPGGREAGLARVIRGSGLDVSDEKQRDRPLIEYHTSTNRAGIAPGFGAIAAGHSGNGFGHHRIGFRVVEGRAPATFLPEEIPFVRQGVKRIADRLEQGPDPARPYFRKRHALPSPPDNRRIAERAAAGLPAGLRFHNHSPALAVCANGDLLAAWFSADTMNRSLFPPPPWHKETAPNVAVIAARLRHGADQWDMPEVFWDFPDVNDGGPLMWTDPAHGDRIHFFIGNNRLPGAFPFQWATSDDGGASWSEVRFPRFLNQVGAFDPQPINTAIQDRDGTLYVPLDAEGPTSVLMATDDGGASWYDTGGRTGGRHTTLAFLRDGRILGLGGKESGIDGYTPRSISADGGRTWSVGPTPFPRQGGNQRPSLLRLRSGRLLFAGDFQNIWGAKPAGVTGSGAYVALSEDEGETWRIKTLPGVQRHESHPEIPTPGTIGYSVARQSADGLIHLLTTMNDPCLHFEFNEAWILAPEEASPSEAALMAARTTAVTALQTHREFHPDGTLAAQWTAGVGDDGRYLLHGRETWYFAGGGPRYEADHALGRKQGLERFWREDGALDWQRDHRADGGSLWTRYWPGGKPKAESSWRGQRAEGLAQRWREDGTLLSTATFRDGHLVELDGAPYVIDTDAP